MKERTLRILEFNKVKNKLRNYAVTSGGKELIDALSPYNSIYEVENKLEETNEALDILIKKGTPPFEGLHETKEELEKIRNLGADYIQGYYYSRPVGHMDFWKLITA